MISKLHNQKKQKGFTLIELMIVVAIIGILAAVAIPAFMKYIKKSKTSEARQFVKKISDGARAYYMDNHGSRTSLLPIPKQFPEDINVVTPAARDCCDTEKCEPLASDWGDPSWIALNFSVDDPHYYKYNYTTADVLTTYTSQAVGDLDCDGVTSLFELRGGILANDDAPTAGASIYRENETE